MANGAVKLPFVPVIDHRGLGLTLVQAGRARESLVEYMRMVAFIMISLVDDCRVAEQAQDFGIH